MPMKSVDKKKKIIVDADVIIHFSKGEQLFLLTRIFPNQLYIVKDVFLEVFKGPLRMDIENLLKMSLLKELDFSSEIEVIMEYARLKKKFGPGESACMAYCKFHSDVLASSNLKDIKQYCKENEIAYLTTMDFIEAAFETGLLTEKECDIFINNVITRGSKLPNKTFAEYRKTH
jgi:hypothetical protein